MIINQNKKCTVFSASLARYSKDYLGELSALNSCVQKHVLKRSDRCQRK